GLFLNIAVCGALMRDLEWTKANSKRLRKDRKAKNRERRNKTRSQSLRTQTSSQTSSQNLPTYPSLDELKVLLQDGRVPPGVLPSDKQDGPVELSRFCSSVVNLPTYVRNGEKVPFEVLELLSNNQSLYHLLLQNYPGLMISSHSFSDSGRLHENFTAGGKKQQPLEAPVKLIEKGAPSPLVVIPHPAVPSKPVVVTPSKKAKEPANQVTGEEALILLQQQPGSEKKMTTAHLRDIRMHRYLDRPPPLCWMSLPEPEIKGRYTRTLVNA
ncbi:unnamed protein product, partial [Timema podura]|nr:unnamed protein product [Timema podura]